MGVGPQLVPPQVDPEEASDVSVESILKRYLEHIAQFALKTKHAVERRIKAAKEFLNNMPPEHWQDRDSDGKLMRLSKGKGAINFITFLLLYGYLRPGYAFLFSCRFYNLTGESLFSPHEPEIRRFVACATQLGFRPRYSLSLARVVLHLLIQSGKSLDGLTFCDLTELRHAINNCANKPATYHPLLFSLQNILYHLGILERPATNSRKFDGDWEKACAEISQEDMRKTTVAFLEQLSAIHRPSTVRAYSEQLQSFTKYLKVYHPDIGQFSQLRRDEHIEPWLLWHSKRLTLRSGKPLSLAYRITSIIRMRCFFNYLVEWGWDACPPQRLLFDFDIPKTEVLLPRFIPPEKETLLMAAIHKLPEPLIRYGLFILRNTGMRIGELLNLEMDCVHHIPGVGCWVKIPLGKLRTERMVPIDEETLSYFDALVKCRGVQKPLPDPKDGTLRDYLMVRHGKRISVNYLRSRASGLLKAAQMADLTSEAWSPDRITPHKLRHTYATSLVNAGLSLPALMSLLGHVSMEMSLRYGRMSHHTIRKQYDRALEQIKSKYAALTLNEPVQLFQATRISATQSDWMIENYYKTRLVHGFCLRAPEQGACPHANICEQCLAFHPFHEFFTAIYQQLQDVQSLIKDARIRGWNTEANRHLELAARLDEFLNNYGFTPPSKKRGRPKKENDE